MTCPFTHLPEIEVCRENRRMNRLAYGKAFRPCASCGRDLGKKPKEITRGGGCIGNQSDQQRRELTESSDNIRTVPDAPPPKKDGAARERYL